MACVHKIISQITAHCRLALVLENLNTYLSHDIGKITQNETKTVSDNSHAQNKLNDRLRQLGKVLYQIIYP